MRTVIAAAALLTLAACHSAEPAPEVPAAPVETDAAPAPTPAAPAAEAAPEAAAAPTGLTEGTLGAGTVQVTVVGGGTAGTATTTDSTSAGH